MPAVPDGAIEDVYSKYGSDNLYRFPSSMSVTQNLSPDELIYSNDIERPWSAPNEPL